MLRVVGTRKNPLNIVNFQVRLDLAAMQKNWSLFLQNSCFCRIVLLVKLVCIFEPSPVLAAVKNAIDLLYCKKCSELLVLVRIH